MVGRGHGIERDSSMLPRRRVGLRLEWRLLRASTLWGRDLSLLSGRVCVVSLRRVGCFELGLESLGRRLFGEREEERLVVVWLLRMSLLTLRALRQREVCKSLCDGN